MDRNSLDSLRTTERSLDQVFLIRRQGGAVIEAGSFSLTSVHVLQGVSIRSRSVGPRLSSRSFSGAARAHTCRGDVVGIAATHLVHILREPGVGDHDANVLQPCPYILEAVTGSKEITNFGPCLPDLAGLRPRFFPRLRAESSEIEFFGGLAGHTGILRRFTESFQEVSKKFPVSGSLQKVSRKFPIVGRHNVMKSSEERVVEHKGCAGRAGAFLSLARLRLRHLQRLSILGLRPAFAGRLLGGRYAE